MTPEETTASAESLGPDGLDASHARLARGRRVGFAPAQGRTAAVSSRHAYRRIGLAVALSDVGILIAGLRMVRAFAPMSPRVLDTVWTLTLAPLVWVGIFAIFGLYDVKRLTAFQEFRLTAFHEFRGIVGATTAGVLVVTLTGLAGTGELSKISLLILCAVTLVSELIVRASFRRFIERGRRDHGPLSLRTLLVGANEDAIGLARRLARPAHGFAPIGLVAPSDERVRAADVPVLGTLMDLEDTVRRHGAEAVFVAADRISPDELRAIRQACRRADVDLHIATNIADVLPSRTSVQQVDDLLAVVVKPARLTGTQAFVKRAFDLVLASILIVLSLPLMLLIAIAVKVDSGGRVLFRQTRVTKDGTEFEMYKFRTMVEEEPPLALASDVDHGAARSRQDDRTALFYKMNDDQRTTRVGKILRSFSLDEVPQMLNVIRGEMSLVGPRPLPVEQVRANHEVVQARHEVLGGITGLWQISGRSDLTSTEALWIDRYYIENWSLGLDLYILAKTVGAVLLRRGAR